MTVVYINGFETGDLSQLDTVGAGAAIETTNVRTGGYSFKYGTATCKFVVAGIATTQSAVRLCIKTSAAPSATQGLLVENPNTTTRLRLTLNLTTGFLGVTDAGVTLGLVTTAGSINVCDGSFHVIDLTYDLAAGGVVKVWVDNTLDINVTHTSDVSATTTTSWGCNGFATAVIYMDDLRIDKGTLTQIGAGQIIARQGLAGTPTYDAWTKNGAATAALCWSDTPFGTGTNCTSSTSAAAQTMLIAPFSAAQAGHGTQVVNAQDTVNAAKTALIIKRATSGNPKIRRRVNGSDTDTAIVATAADKYFDDGIWTTTVANLDLLEAGVVKAADANLTTVEDVWVMVDYTKANPYTQTVSASAGLVGTVTRSTRKINSGSVGLIGTVVRQTGKIASGSAGLAGTVVRSTGKIASASCGLTGTVVRSTHKSISGSIGVVGAVVKSIGKTISGVIGAIGSVVATFISGGGGGSSTSYGVTGGPGMSVYTGVVHSNAHGVGGQQKNLSGVEGIPGDAPQ